MLYPIQQMPDDSKVWIYQANRQLTLEEIGEMEQLIEGFVEKWEAHKQSVKGFGGIFYKRFIVLMADESVAEVSGCSIDGSVRLIKEIEQAFDLNFFDRLKITYKITNQLVGSFALSQINDLWEKSSINENTIVFNNLVQTKGEFETNGKYL
ncbi:MAG: ABC transporter ATPase [Bacteroidetes bacterium]|nr:ABC transporter ATPase [Bacteroidota bacterium]